MVKKGSECSEVLALRLHHLVVTKDVDDKPHLFMTNSVHQHIDRSAMPDLTIYPGMQEWKDTLDKLNTLQQQIEHDVKFNPMVLPIEPLPRYLQQFQDELEQFDKLENQLKRLEPQISKYNIDFTSIYSNIHESRRQGETKLQLMTMFEWG